jgi:Type II secretion system (T2SS), protein F
MNQTVAALALAAAVLAAAARPGSARLRAATAASGTPVDRPAVRPRWIAVGVIATGASAWATTGNAAAAVLSAAVPAALGLVTLKIGTWPSHRDDDPAGLAAAWAQLAVCLEIGLPVSAAVAAAAEPLEGSAGAALRRVAGLLELGADAGQAWQTADETPSVSAFARAAGRSANTGAALARAARVESARLQAAQADAAEARAQRAAVLITAPLGLCFLPAFVVLGIAPVVVGLAHHALTPW